MPGLRQKQGGRVGQPNGWPIRRNARCFDSGRDWCTRPSLNMTGEEWVRCRLHPEIRMESLRNLLKSMALGLAGAGVFSFFFMMAVIPTLAVIARSGPHINQQSVVVDPAWAVRTVGMPLAAVAFAVCFALAWRKFRRQEQAGDSVGPSAVI